MPIHFIRSPNEEHFVRATKRAKLPILKEEIDNSVVVVDADLHDVWLELIPGQGSLPEDAPAINQSIVYVVEEKGTNDDGQTTVVVWWLERAALLLPESEDQWTPMRAPGPTSGADPSGIIFTIFAMLCPLLTITSRGIENGAGRLGREARGRPGSWHLFRCGRHGGLVREYLRVTVAAGRTDSSDDNDDQDLELTWIRTNVSL